MHRSLEKLSFKVQKHCELEYYGTFAKRKHCKSEELIITRQKQTNSVVWVRERTIPTERTPFVGEVSANFCG
jgi:hypothetical protein